MLRRNMQLREALCGFVGALRAPTETHTHTHMQDFTFESLPTYSCALRLISNKQRECIVCLRTATLTQQYSITSAALHT